MATKAIPSLLSNSFHRCAVTTRSIIGGGVVKGALPSPEGLRGAVSMFLAAVSVPRESANELVQDFLLGCLFAAIAVVAAFKYRRVANLQEAETPIKTFYFLILGASALRAVWFFIPSSLLEPSYTPSAVWAWRTPGWGGTLFSEMLLSSGSLCLFAIFVLIIIFWAYLLKKVFKPESSPGVFRPVRKYEPMTSFMAIIGCLAAFQVANCILFMAGMYSSEVVTLLDSLMLALLSMVCVVEISIFSHRFRSVLTTLGAINEVPIENQVKTIVWFTIVGNAFFVVRATLEVILAVSFTILWREGKPLSTLGRHHWWDAYILVKHVSELAILVLMLYKLQGRKTSRVNHAHHPGQYSHAHSAGGSGAKEIKPNKREYTEVKDVSLEEGHGIHKAANGQAPH